MSEPGNEAGGVADNPVVDPVVKGKIHLLKEDWVDQLIGG